MIKFKISIMQSYSGVINMANLVYIATSLEGFIARVDGDISWLESVPNASSSDFGYGEFINKIDGVILGRNTFEVVLGFESWPYTQPVFVLSNTLDKIPEELKDKVEIVNGELKSILKTLDEKGIHNLYIDGGKTIQSFLKEDLIDEMIITTVPILLGDGIPLFGYLERDLKFKCEKVEYISQFVVKNYYTRDKENWGIK
jgi:dihydrofolate reductase